MPAKYFLCPIGLKIEIDKCLEDGGCEMKERCATRPFLRAIAYDREWKGVSPSSAGNGPRLLYLKATTYYTTDPNDRVFAVFGTSTHNKLSIHKYTYNVFSEEKLSDKEMSGIPDVLEIDESNNNKYVLTDYKTWGSFKVAKALGIVQKDEPVIENGEPVLLKSGVNKGKAKTVKKNTIDLSTIDLIAETLQLNRYRIFFERYGFPISKMQIQIVSRDGGTFIAKNRGIERNLYVIPIAYLADEWVDEYYKNLQAEIDEAFKTGYARKCDSWESWEGRRCDGYCEIAEECKKMEGIKNERASIRKS